MKTPGTPRSQELFQRIGANLKRLRLAAGHSGSTLAAAATDTGFKTVSTTEVSRLETGSQTWTLAQVWAFAEALEVDLGDLLGIEAIAQPLHGAAEGQLDPYEEALIRHARVGNAEGALMALAPLLAKGSR